MTELDKARDDLLDGTISLLLSLEGMVTFNPTALENLIGRIRRYRELKESS